MLLAGTNSVISTWQALTSASANPSSSALSGAVSTMRQTVAALLVQITTLRARLATSANPADFLVLPLPPLAKLPISTYTSSSSQAVLLELTTAYNDALTAGIASLGSNPNSTVLSWDIPSLIGGYIAQPATAGVSCIGFFAIPARGLT